jgi:hypothetical protein
MPNYFLLFTELVLREEHCNVYGVITDGVLTTGFIDNLQLVTASNYNAIAKSHALQFTTVRIKSSQAAVSSPIAAW